jgi:hypothetical protein
MKLDPGDIEVIARRVAELIAGALPPAPPAVRYVDAAEVARVLGVERDCVYAHARELGAVRLGGPQGRLRFDLKEVSRLLAERQAPPLVMASAAGSAGRPGPAGRSTGAGRRTELTSSSRRARGDPARRRQKRDRDAARRRTDPDARA